MNEIIIITDLLIEYSEEKLRGDYRRALNLNQKMYGILFEMRRKADGEMRSLLSKQLESLLNDGQELARLKVNLNSGGN